MLNQEQIDTFKDKGYLIVDKFIDADSIALLIHRAETLIDNFDLSSHTTCSVPMSRSAQVMTTF